MYTSYIAYNSCEYKQSISHTKKIKFVAFKEENNTIFSDEQINSEEIKTLSDEPKECSDTQIINTGQNITENPFEDEQTQKSEETINSNWSTRELSRQIESGLYQRLLLSDGKANKEKVLQLAKEGQIIEQPKDIIKEPDEIEAFMQAR